MKTLCVCGQRLWDYTHTHNQLPLLLSTHSITVKSAADEFYTAINSLKGTACKCVCACVNGLFALRVLYM